MCQLKLKLLAILVCYNVLTFALLHLLWIFVSIRRLLQLIVCIGISTVPPPYLKNITPSFAKSPLKSENYPRPARWKPRKSRKKQLNKVIYHLPLKVRKYIHKNRFDIAREKKTKKYKFSVISGFSF